MHQSTLEEAKTNLQELIEAAFNGEEVTIAKDEKHVVKLVPVNQDKTCPQFGSAKGQVWMADDFDAPLEDFAAYEK